MSADESRYFTVSEANAALPGLRDAFQRVFQVRPQLATSYRNLSDAGFEPQRDDFDGLEPSLDLEDSSADVMREYGRFRALSATLRDDIALIHTTGCTIKNLADGLVDWPAIHRGREVYLCWRYGEDEIGFWHEIEDGFAGRRSVDELAG